MNTVSFLQIIICLVIAIVLIVILTARLRVHAFFALLIACFVVGIGTEMPMADILATIKEGFGHIMQSLGLIIVLGTTLGVVLERTGSTQVMADVILRRTGKKNASFAMNLTGFVVGMPLFCDSGYIVMSGLSNSLARKTAIPMAIMAISLATGLYSVHCLIPPHPGASAAAGIIGVDYGRLMLAGIGVAIPATAAGYLWARFAGRRWAVEQSTSVDNEQISPVKLPSPLMAFLPVITPILLIAGSSVWTSQENNWWQSVLKFLGEPSIALSVGLLLAILSIRSNGKKQLADWLTEGAEKAGSILVIIGAGGAFGAILAAANIGDHLSQSLPLESMGLLFPFLVAFLIKTAQGSSTVAIMTAAAITLPLLSSLGLESDNARLFCVLSMGAGSMMLSHANDAYFWVIARFSGLQMPTMLKVYTVATFFMGSVSMIMIWILSRVMGI